MNQAPQIVLTDAPKQRLKPGQCPKCFAGREKRVASSGGFGESLPHDICSECAYEFDEFTTDEPSQNR